MDSAASTDMFGNKITNTNWTVPQNTGGGNAAQTRRPGNWFTHLLPTIGAIGGSIIADPILGGAGGGALGKVLENKLEAGSYKNIGQKAPSLLSGALGQGVIGGVSGGVGELAAPLLGKAIQPAAD